ncbi:hypothetical protein IPJ72_02215 [Candidatus Peregrinibacteria bacterium]|nr:MAG: hypothetical protein IPJ72_02215 [Candidatus Peregrinibacteria bacterium]
MQENAKKPIALAIILTTLVVGGIMHAWNYQRIRKLGYQFFQQTSELQ